MYDPNHRTPPTITGSLSSTLLSPGSLLALSIFGYYSIAAAGSALFTDGGVDGLILRGVMFALLLLGVFLYSGNRDWSRAFVPMIIFSVFYIFRILHNYLISDSPPPWDMTAVLQLFFIGGLVPAIAVSSMRTRLRDDGFSRVASTLCIVFILGLLFSSSISLFDPQDRRLQFDKINAISMGNMAATFLLYYFVFIAYNRRIRIEAVLFVLPLLWIFVYAQSRGAYLAAAGSVVIYLILIRKNRRGTLVVLGSLSAVAVAAYFGREYLDVIWDRLGDIDIVGDRSSYLHYVAYNSALEAFYANPVFGSSIIENVTGYYPHNIFVESLMSVGVVGSVPFLLHLILATRAAIGIIRGQGSTAVAVFVSLVFFQTSIAGGFSGSIWGNTVFWIASTVCISIWYGRIWDDLRARRRARSSGWADVGADGGALSNGRRSGPVERVFDLRYGG